MTIEKLIILLGSDSRVSCTRCRRCVAAYMLADNDERGADISEEWSCFRCLTAEELDGISVDNPLVLNQKQFEARWAAKETAFLAKIAAERPAYASFKLEAVTNDFARIVVQNGDKHMVVESSGGYFSIKDGMIYEQGSMDDAGVSLLGVLSEFMGYEIKAMSPESQGEGPRYKHECTMCIFLGQYGIADLYFCSRGGCPVVLTRYSNDAAEYTSGLEATTVNPELQEAQRRAEERHLL